MADTLTVISFGYLHLASEAPPAADRIEDVREQLADPASYEAVLALLETGPVDGLDPRVQDIVLGQPKARALLDELTAEAPNLSTIAIGCGQGHDRSVVLAEVLAARVREVGRLVTVDHWHIRAPRVRAAGDAP